MSECSPLYKVGQWQIQALFLHLINRLLAELGETLSPFVCIEEENK